MCKCLFCNKCASEWPQRLDIWRRSKRCIIIIIMKVHCISTEFTARKHGGERGVPFRVQIETYADDGYENMNLQYCASCQVKVFKVCQIVILSSSSLRPLAPPGLSRRTVFNTILVTPGDGKIPRRRRQNSALM